MPTRDDLLLEQLSLSNAQWSRVYDDQRRDYETKCAESDTSIALLRAENGAKDAKIRELSSDNAALRTRVAQLSSQPTKVVRAVDNLKVAVSVAAEGAAWQTGQVARGKIGYTLTVIVLTSIAAFIMDSAGVTPARIVEVLHALLP